MPAIPSPVQTISIPSESSLRLGPGPRTLPPDGTAERLIIAAYGGDLTAAKAHLLEWKATVNEPAEDMYLIGPDRALLHIVAAQDPAFTLEILKAYRRMIPEDEKFQAFEQQICSGVLGEMHQDVWRSADSYPYLRPGLRELNKNGKVEPLPPEQAMRVLDPAYDLDKATVVRCCAASHDPRVLSRLVERISKGDFGGVLPAATRLNLADWRTSQPDEYKVLTEKMPAEMRAQIPGDALFDKARVFEGAASDASLDGRELRDVGYNELPTFAETWRRLGQPIDIAQILKGESGKDPRTLEKLCCLIAVPDYLGSHREQISEQMSRLAGDPDVDSRSFQKFAGRFADVCASFAQDESAGMPWISALADDDRETYLNRYARHDPRGMLKYAEEKMPPGPERDAVIEKATAELP